MGFGYTKTVCPIYCYAVKIFIIVVVVVAVLSSALDNKFFEGTLNPKTPDDNAGNIERLVLPQNANSSADGFPVAAAFDPPPLAFNSGGRASSSISSWRRPMLYEKQNKTIQNKKESKETNQTTIKKKSYI